MKMHWTAASAAMALAVCTAGKYGLKDAMVRFKVVDDQGQPVTNARVVAYSLSNHKGEGRTDEKGEFAYFARNIYPPLSGKLSKEGHYRSRGVVWRGPFGVAPTNIFTVVLRRIVDPVPMVRKEVLAFFPVLGEPVGFDFEAGDWVDPHGKGKVTDVLITGRRESMDPLDMTCGAMLVVSNALDGFLEFPLVRNDGNDRLRSDFQPPQTAPDSGYAQRVEAYTRYRHLSGKPLAANFVEDREYAFRMRTETNHVGNAVRSHVGWFDNSLKVGIAGKGAGVGMEFSYYWNPDPQSRSLEPKEIADRQGR